MGKLRRALANGVLAAMAVLALSSGMAWAKTKVTFYYPIQVSGPLAQVIDVGTRGPARLLVEHRRLLPRARSCAALPDWRPPGR